MQSSGGANGSQSSHHAGRDELRHAERDGYFAAVYSGQVVQLSIPVPTPINRLTTNLLTREQYT